MIIVCLKGGLGNQMFQYAAGRRVACLQNVPLKLDLSWYGKNFLGETPRSYALAPFSINAEIATEQEIAKLFRPDTGRIKRFVNLLNPFYRQSHIREKKSHFNSSFRILPDSYLDGYWQSEKYFKDIAPIIRHDFTMRAAPDGFNRKVSVVINDCNAVSIHFRRGDYITDAKTGKHHGVCSIDYYKSAVELVATRVVRPHFFVFSDEPAWVSDNFKIPHPMTVISHNGPDQPHEDLRLMSLCRHHIIANSSFSWWGAWLNPRPDKVVIAPARWFNDSSIDTRDILPTSWLTSPL